jgi:hypothetical protein
LFFVMEDATCINMLSISSITENTMEYNDHDGSPVTNTDAGNFFKLGFSNISLLMYLTFFFS